MAASSVGLLGLLFLAPILIFVVMSTRVPSAPGSLFTFVVLLLLASFGLVGVRAVADGGKPSTTVEQSWQTEEVLEEVLKWL